MSELFKTGEGRKLVQHVGEIAASVKKMATMMERFVVMAKAATNSSPADATHPTQDELSEAFQEGVRHAFRSFDRPDEHSDNTGAPCNSLLSSDHPHCYTCNAIEGEPNGVQPRSTPFGRWRELIVFCERWGDQLSDNKASLLEVAERCAAKQ